MMIYLSELEVVQLTERVIDASDELQPHLDELGWDMIDWRAERELGNGHGGIYTVRCSMCKYWYSEDYGTAVKICDGCDEDGA